MKDLIKLEFRKLKRQKSFYIILAIMLVMVIISALTYKFLENLTAEMNEIGEAFGETFSATGESVLLGFLSSANFSLLAAIFVAIVVCDDYGSGIVKNIFSRGYSRADFYFAKLIYLLCTTTVMFVSSFTVAGISGALLFGFSGDVNKTVVLISTQYLACVATVTMYYAICSAIKKLGASIAAGIIAPSVVSLVLSLADTAINSEKFKINDYFITSFTTTLSNISVETSRIIVCAALSVVYAALFIVLGFESCKRVEV